MKRTKSCERRVKPRFLQIQIVILILSSIVFSFLHSGFTDAAGAHTQLTFEDSFQGYPRYSTDGSKIVYCSAEGGNLEVYTMDFDGSNHQRLTNTASNFEYYPVYSPEGSKIAFISLYDDGANGAYELWMMDSNGSNKVQLTNEAYKWDDYAGLAPHFNPDGTKIVYASKEDEGNYFDIWTLTRNGAEWDSSVIHSQLTSEDYNQDSPAFSPNGTKIVYRSLEDGGSNKDIWMMDSDGTDHTQLTTDTTIAYRHPSFSPNGSHIIYSKPRDGGAYSNIWVMEADGANPTQLTSEDFRQYHPCFNPSGTEVVYYSEEDGGDYYDIWSVETPEYSSFSQLDHIVLMPTSAWVYVGDFVDFDATGYNDNGQINITWNVTWSVTGGGTIDGNGLFTPITGGKFTVKAENTSTGIYDTSSVDVYYGGTDTDKDGLADADEDTWINTNATEWDTDSDGMPDGWEWFHGFIAWLFNDPTEDWDMDGLTNIQEYNYSKPESWNESIDGTWWNGTDPRDSDTDDDSLADSWESTYNLDPLDNGTKKIRWDIEQRMWIWYGTGNKNNGGEGDPDLDGATNYQEYTRSIDPRDWDSDDDAIPDGWEIIHGLIYIINDADDDRDGDTLSNIEEYNYSRPVTWNEEVDGVWWNGTDPNNRDTDNDTLSDNWEIIYGLNPRDNGTFNESNGASGDQDNDDLINEYEHRLGTSPIGPDTDGDGMPDGWEVRYGLEPRLQWDKDEDPDADSLTNLEEFRQIKALNGSEISWPCQTDPSDQDTDDDGFSDGYEVTGYFMYHWNYAWNYTGFEGEIFTDLDAILVSPSSSITYNLHFDETKDINNSYKLYIYGNSMAEMNPNVTGGLNGSATQEINISVFETGFGYESESFAILEGNIDENIGGITIKVTNTHSIRSMRITSIMLIKQGGLDPCNPDTDSDGISDGKEPYVDNGYISSPLIFDSDYDGLSDGLEMGNASMGDEDNTTITDPMNIDTDNDGLLDSDEDKNHNGRVDPGETDPNKPDTDNDGIEDKIEDIFDYDPTDPDSDRDGILDGDEDFDSDGLSNALELGNETRDEDPTTTTDPLKPDSDGDGLVDGEEDENANGKHDIIFGENGEDILGGETDPNSPDSDADSVNDGEDPFPMDYFESQDTDGDGIGNNQDDDDDGDGMLDNWEKQHGFDPLNSSDAALDPDGDGLTNLEEFQGGSDPLNPKDGAKEEGLDEGTLLFWLSIIIIVIIVIALLIFLIRRNEKKKNNIGLEEDNQDKNGWEAPRKDRK